MPPRNLTLAVAMASHNRRSTTLECLASLHAQTALSLGVQMQVYLLDDASTDGTAQAVGRQFPNVQILQGTGSLFWNGGMRRALAAAMRQGHDFYLLLNDDTRLDLTALERLLDTSDQFDNRAIIVGATRDADSAALTYGGLRSSRSALKFDRVPKSDQPEPADTFNGQCVLIPASAARLVGNLNRVFTHSMGDIDYGLRAKSLGVPIWAAPGSVGECAANLQVGNYSDQSLSRWRRLKLMMQPKGLPPLEWLYFSVRHGGVLSLLRWAGTYVRVAAARKSTGEPPVPLAILTNIVSPYRVPLFSRIAKTIPSRIFVSNFESNRDTWPAIPPDASLHISQSKGFAIAHKIKSQGQTYDKKWLHINPGYFVDLLRCRPQAVISFEMGVRTICALVYGTLFSRPVWVWWGGTLHTERNIGPLRKIVRWVISRWAKHWISYGQTSTEYLQSLGIAGSTILQIQNCADDRSFAPAEPRPTPDRKPVLLYVGQMIGRKGLGGFLESAARVQNEGLEFSLLLVGNGDERDALERQATRLNLKDVRFLSAREPAQMPEIYRSADCLVFPTLEDVWGLVVNESLLCGLPVISSLYAGCAAEILPETNIFDPLEPQDFDRALRMAIRGQAAPADARQLKSTAQVADMICAEIQQNLAA